MDCPNPNCDEAEAGVLVQEPYGKALICERCYAHEVERKLWCVVRTRGASRRILFTDEETEACQKLAEHLHNTKSAPGDLYRVCKLHDAFKPLEIEKHTEAPVGKSNVIYIDEAVIKLTPQEHKLLEERVDEMAGILGLDEVDEEVFADAVDAMAGWQKEDKPE